MEPSQETCSVDINENNNQFMFFNQAFFRVPLETYLNSIISFQKKIERDFLVISMFLEKKILQEVNQNSLLKRLDKVLEKLWNLHDLVNTSLEDSENNLQTIINRLHRINIENESEEINTISGIRGSKIYLNSILHEYLMRKGYLKTAEILVKEEDLKEMVDISIYTEYHFIIENLKQHNSKPAIEWCNANTARLKQLNLNLESQLHLYHLLELVMTDKTLEAIEYVKHQIPSELFSTSKDIRRVFTLLAFRNTNVQPYENFFDKIKWTNLITSFEKAYAMANHHMPITTIEILLQAGFSALKTNDCCESNVYNCPTCVFGDFEYLKSLSTPHHIQSILICQITGEVMNSDNPPYMSPKKRLFSKNGLQILKANSSDGLIVCPHTKETFKFKQCKRLYIT